MAKSRSLPGAERLVVIACRAPRSLREKILKLAHKDRRSQSDYVRLLLIDAVKRVDAKESQVA